MAENAENAVLETGHLVSIVIEKLQGWVEGFVAMLPNLVVALFVVVAFALLARLARSLIERVARRAALNEELVSLLGTTVRLSVLATGLFAALGLLQLEKTVTSLLAGIGVIGLALGFAFQDIASNFMSGIIMAIRTPFRVGDLVETHDHMGTVQRVTLRATVLRNFTGQDVIIPNKDVLQNPIVNYTQAGLRRVDVEVGVSYDDDLRLARDTAIQAVQDLEGRDPSRDVSFDFEGFGASSIDGTLRFWIPSGDDGPSYLEVRSAAVIAVKRAFDEAGITIPFPIRTLEFAGSPGREATREGEPAQMN